MRREWSDFEKFNEADEKYLPAIGEGETMASQITTAVCKLVYKWFNDGDVFDNQHGMQGWCNDLSSYANWLIKYVPEAKVLNTISDCFNDSGYEDLLWTLCEKCQDMKLLAKYEKKEKIGSIYECDGPFKFVEDDDFEDEEDW